MIFIKSNVRKRLDLREKIEVKKARLQFLTNTISKTKRIPACYIDEAADLYETIAKLEIKLRRLQ